jgi:diketogulonate reductase-like aldo/keto reductase
VPAPTKPIAPGVEMPVLGLGLWQVPEGRVTTDAVRWALEAGYRHLDTAQGYGNEAGVGRGLRESGIDRDEVFVTTKFDPTRRDPEAELEASLGRLGLERVDLYLLHWPEGGATAAWPGMERALERGLASSIGVSNFSARELDRVVADSRVRPAVNQIQLSPFEHRRRLVDACDRHGIAVEAYSPLTTGARLGDPAVAEVASRTGRTPAQVMLRWGLQHGFAVIPKSVDRERIAENIAALDFELGAEDMEALDALDRTGGTGRARESPWWTRRGRARARAVGLLSRLRQASPAG